MLKSDALSIALETPIESDPLFETETRLWLSLDLVTQACAGSRLKRGQVLFQLRCLYEDRHGGNRRGVSILMAELKQRGHSPRTAREQIHDFIAARDGTPTAAELRAARQALKVPKIQAAENPLLVFARLLSRNVINEAYCAQACEVDGDAQRMGELTLAWADLHPANAYLFEKLIEKTIGAGHVR